MNPLSFDIAYLFSIRHRRFTRVRLPDPHLARSCPAFSLTLTTMALYQCSLRWFEACPCKPAPRGRPSSLLYLRGARSPTKNGYLATVGIEDFRSKESNVRHQREPSASRCMPWLACHSFLLYSNFTFHYQGLIVWPVLHFQDDVLSRFCGLSNQRPAFNIQSTRKRIFRAPPDAISLAFQLPLKANIVGVLGINPFYSRFFLSSLQTLLILSLTHGEVALLQPVST